MSICILIVPLWVRHPNANPVLVHTGLSVGEVGLNATAIYDISETLTLIFLVGAMVGNDHFVSISAFLLRLVKPEHAHNYDEPGNGRCKKSNVEVVHPVLSC